MRALGPNSPIFVNVGRVVVISALTAACSVYQNDLVRRGDGVGGASGAGGANSSGGVGSTGGSGGAGSPGGAGGKAGSTDASADDVSASDAETSSTDVAPDRHTDGPTNPGDGEQDATLADIGNEGPSDATDPDIRGADGSADGPNPDAASSDVGAPDANDAAASDVGLSDASDAGPLGPQTLPVHGSPIQKADAGAPFDSRCANDEVVTGIVGRAGVQTDAIAATCSKFISGVLSSPHNLPLNGNVTGGSAYTVACPANYIGVGIVGRYGHNTMWMEDVTTMIGLVCKDLASSAQQIVTITGQPALDSGYTSFREDCSGGRYLTNISGIPDSNSLAYTVGQVGGECNVR